MEPPNDTIPYKKREDLTGDEREAIGMYMENWEFVNATLRKPKETKELEEWDYFPNLIYHIDRAISKSSAGNGSLLFREMHGDFAARALFCLDIPTGGPEDSECARPVPHIIRDLGYCSFFEDLEYILDDLNGARGRRVILVYKPRTGDTGLYLDETGGEVLFPRETLWITTGYSYASWQDCRAAFISVDRYEAR